MKMFMFVLTILVTLSLHGAAAAETSLVAGELKIIGDDFKFTEGPATDAEGNVYFTDIRAEKIYTWSTDGKLGLFRQDTGGANGLYFDQAGNLYACEGLNQRITFISPDGTIEVLADEFNGKGFNKPNDLWIDPQGGVYFTDPAYGKTEKKQDGEHVYYLLPNRSKVIRVIDDLARPNGIIGTPDGKTLYVANPAEKEIWRYSIKPDATLENKTLFASVLCDGMTLDERGNLYTTPEAVQIFSPEGMLIEEIKTPNRPTNVTFGGKNNRTLFITARAHVYTIEMNVSGME